MKMQQKSIPMTCPISTLYAAVSRANRSFTNNKGEKQYRDTFYPITAEARENLNEAVVNAYENAIAQAQDDGEDFEEIEDEGLSPSM